MTKRSNTLAGILPACGEQESANQDDGRPEGRKQIVKRRK